jgi:hypothetical protein
VGLEAVHRYIKRDIRVDSDFSSLVAPLISNPRYTKWGTTVPATE